MLAGEKVTTGPLSLTVNYSIDSCDIERILHYLVLTATLSYRKHHDKMEVYIPNIQLKIHWKISIIILLQGGYGSIQHEFSQEITAKTFYINTIEDFLRDCVETSFSDFGFNNESSYHIALLSFFRSISENHVTVIDSSNMDGENGRYSILIKVESIKRVFCIKLKCAKQSKLLQKEAENALNQIKENDYGDYERIPIGVAFYKKTMSKLMVESIVMSSVEETVVEPLEKKFPGGI